MSDNTQLVPLSFPLAGVDSSGPVDQQRQMTTRDSLNVRSIEPSELRLRGGSRSGLTQFVRKALPIPDIGLGDILLETGGHLLLESGFFLEMES